MTTNSIKTLSIMTNNVMQSVIYYTGCPVFCIIMLSVILLNVILLSVILLSVILLNVILLSVMVRCCCFGTENLLFWC
jgi:hypothetical protein